MKRKPLKSKRLNKSKRSNKSTSDKLDPFVSGEWIIMDNPKADMTIRPTDIDFKKLLRKFGYPLSLRKKKG